MGAWTVSCTSVCSWLCGTGATAVFLVLGILMLVPAGPWTERNLTGGIILCVFAVIGLAALAGALVGGAIGGATGYTLDKCTDNDY